MKELLEQQLEKCVSSLLKGQVVAFPTETVMGLGVIYNNRQAYDLLNQIKCRPEDKPYTMMVKDAKEISKYAFLDERIQKVIDEFMPGSLTILLKSRDNVPDYVTHKSGVIGIRIPTNEEALELLKRIKLPLLVPSANKSGEKPALNSDEVRAIFKDELGAIIDGESKGEIPSTIIDFSGNKPVLLRNGPISFEKVLEVYERN